MFSFSESGTELITQQELPCYKLVTTLVSCFSLGLRWYLAKVPILLRGKTLNSFPHHQQVSPYLAITTCLIARKYIGSDKEPLNVNYFFSASSTTPKTSDQGLTYLALDLSTSKHAQHTLLSCTCCYGDCFTSFIDRCQHWCCTSAKPSHHQELSIWRNWMPTRKCWIFHLARQTDVSDEDTETVRTTALTILQFHPHFRQICGFHRPRSSSH